MAPRPYVEVWCRRFGLSLEDILGRCRRQDLVFARFFMWYSLHDFLGFTYEAIATDFRRDHSSIVCGAARWRDMLATGDRAAKRITSVGAGVLDNTNGVAPSCIYQEA